MATPDGASSSHGDPVLDGALAEMQSEGAFETSDPADGGASQAAGSASAVGTAAPSGATGDDGSGQRTDASAGATPTDPAAPSAAAADDPLAGTEPFKYGDGKTLDGVYRVPGEGLLVPEDKVASITQLAERADALDRVSRESAALNATYERLSEWRTLDAEGKEQVLRGAEGLQTMRVQHAMLAASFDTLASIFKDPAKFASLVSVDVDANGQLQITPNPAALQHLLTESDLAESRAEQAIRAQLQTLVTPPVQRAAPDYRQHAPAVITQAAGPLDSHLTTEDRALLTAQIGRYVRAVTEDDRRLTPSLQIGSPIVDASFTQAVQHVANMRAGVKKASESAEKAGKFNAGQEKGRQPVPAKTPAPAAPAKGEKDKKVSRSEQWAAPLDKALEEMSIPR